MIRRPNALTRGELARLAEVNLETIRYYEQRGLLPEPPRSVSNYRLYPPEAVDRVAFVKRAKELGFTLKEIGGLLALRDARDVCCVEVLARARAKLADIGARLAELRVQRDALRRLVDECSAPQPIDECPILRAMDGKRTARGGKARERRT